MWPSRGRGKKKPTIGKSYAFSNCWWMPDFKQAFIVAHYFSSHSPVQFSQSKQTNNQNPTKYSQVMLIRTNYCYFFYYICIFKNKHDTILMFVMGMVLLQGFPYISLLAPKQLSWNRHDTDTTQLIFLFDRNQLPHLKPDDYILGHRWRKKSESSLSILLTNAYLKKKVTILSAGIHLEVDGILLRVKQKILIQIIFSSCRSKCKRHYLLKNSQCYGQAE